MTRTSKGRDSGSKGDEPPKRSVGRPKLTIDLDRVAEVALQLYDEHGFDAVSIEAVAEGLGVSRATLYRTVRSMDELHTILLERLIPNVEERAREILDQHTESGDALVALIRFQIQSSIRMKNYMGVYFGWGLSDEAYEQWREWAGNYEKLWMATVSNAIDDGYLDSDDPLVTTRLLLGMVNWVSRWYSSSSQLTAEAIGDAAVKLVLPKWTDKHTDSPSRPTKRRGGRR